MHDYFLIEPDEFVTNFATILQSNILKLFGLFLFENSGKCLRDFLKLPRRELEVRSICSKGSDKGSSSSMALDQ